MPQFVLREGHDPGVVAAINAAGGLTKLAKLLGVTPAAVSRWKRVPAERAAAITLATGVPRAVLRPDLFGDHPGDGSEPDRLGETLPHRVSAAKATPAADAVEEAEGRTAGSIPATGATQPAPRWFVGKKIEG